MDQGEKRKSRAGRGQVHGKKWRNHRKRPSKAEIRKKKMERVAAEEEEREELCARVLEEAPRPGADPSFGEYEPEENNPDNDGDGPKTTLKKFTELPISSLTLKGLKDAAYVKMTLIQRSAIPHALAGRDVLGAAKTGSGKTLAFLVPMLELLYREKHYASSGLGGLIISPTRELAMQIFNVLRRIGRYHPFSAGLLIGGKNVEEERERVHCMNILVCTPGRLLHHMDTTPLFDASSLGMLVLDEADRLLDMGFQKTVDGILDNLPQERQTLLFSATQTKSVQTLARMALKDPEHIGVSESRREMPNKLKQSYIVTDLGQKLDTLWGFVKVHTKHKILAFVSTCKQVRFLYEAFRQLRPGIPLLHIHGKMNQMKRLATYETFQSRKQCLLFATDIAARGLDFSKLDWVIQVDCPEDIDTYVHRAGRTARFNKSGNSMLMLLPSEINMAEKLQDRGIDLQELKVNPEKVTSIRSQLNTLLAQDGDLKYLAMKSVVAYARSVFVMTDKEVFDVTKLPLEEFSASTGLATMPRLRFISGKKGAKKRGPQQNEDEEGDDDVIASGEKRKRDNQTMRVTKRKNVGVLSEHYRSLLALQRADDDAQEESSDDDILIKRSRLQDNDDVEVAEQTPKKRSSSVHRDLSHLNEDAEAARLPFEKMKESLQERDEEDKERYRLLKKEKKRREKEMLRDARRRAQTTYHAGEEVEDTDNKYQEPEGLEFSDDDSDLDQYDSYETYAQAKARKASTSEEPLPIKMEKGGKKRTTSTKMKPKPSINVTSVEDAEALALRLLGE